MSDAATTTEKTEKKTTTKKEKTDSELVVSQDPKSIEAAELSRTIDSFLLGTKTAEKLKPAQIQMCKQTALLFNLNPLKREIHFVPRAVKKKNPQTGYYEETGEFDVSIVIGYEVYIKRAEKLNQLNGWGVKFEDLPTTFNTWVGKGQGRKQIAVKDIKAILTINKKGWDQPFVHETYLSEARQDGSPMWDKMPRFMLRKTVIGQGFRLCFPEDLGGLPYIPEEIGVGTIENGELHEELPATTKTEEVPPAQTAPKAPAPVLASPADLVGLLGLLKRKGKTQDPILSKLKISTLKQLNVKQLASITAQLLTLEDAPQADDTQLNEDAKDVFGTQAAAPVVSGDQIADEVDAGLTAQHEQEGAM